MILIQHTKLPSKFDHDVIKLTVVLAACTIQIKECELECCGDKSALLIITHHIIIHLDSSSFINYIQHFFFIIIINFIHYYY